VETPAGAPPMIGPFVYGTDGSGAGNLIVQHGAFRNPLGRTAKANGEMPPPPKPTLFMDGGEIFAFTLSTIPGAVELLLERAGVDAGQVDLFVFHQANRHMLDSLRRKTRIAPEKFLVCLADCGNTVSATIPIALSEAHRAGRLRRGTLVALVGFGVGYSWAAALCRWGGR
ncbi:MAG: 3-oxoacyl-ACP synthase III family protein, partial [Rhodospirillaceae bacterium]